MDRAQAYTLEGTIAAIVVVLAVFYGLQAVDTGPWSGDSDREPDQLGTQAADFLSVTAANGSLGEAVRCYSSSKPVIDGDSPGGDPAPFERQLNHTFDRQGVNYNLYVSYWTGSDGRERAVLTSTDDDSLAIPQQNAGSATYQLALYDDDRARYDDDCSDEGPRISDLDDFYVPDVNEDSQLYNVVEVRLIVW
ncbi:hypothetical protein SAMN05216559_1526 [Halomicrobium zhouii]|uniref:Uncharacterized protein n=1 Tax=Halomicrobium zhouii TaxID=767519 RepID=A0A1I6KT67_9EURY|nr:hypothetical protein [Halomicrobium zhouii]SFR94443.1 hypothetical protein SAMN05216559_1526 [Halomicrobium zhouii]